MSMPPGPEPKRDDQRRRRNKPAGGEADKLPSGGPAVWPSSSSEWHPMATEWYESMQASGQAVLFERSDAAQIWITAEMVSRMLYMPRSKPNAQLVSAVFAAMGETMSTEGARRKLRLELHRDGLLDDTPAAPVLDIVDRRKRTMEA